MEILINFFIRPGTEVHRTYIVEKFYHKIRLRDKQDVFFDNYAVLGIETGSIPWATLLADHLRSSLGYVRKVSETHGPGRLIEGVFECDSNTIVVEDVVNFGWNSIRACLEVRNCISPRSVECLILLDK